MMTAPLLAMLLLTQPPEPAPAAHEPPAADTAPAANTAPAAGQSPPPGEFPST